MQRRSARPTGMVISAAEEYDLLGRLLTIPPGGSASRPSARDYRARSSLPRRLGDPGERRRAAPSPEKTSPARRFAFCGRVSTEDNQDPDASRNWQISRSRALIEPAGGIIVAEYFDIGQSRSLPWARRPRAAQLLADLANPGHAVVIGEPQRAFCGNQYSLTMPVLTHYGVELWVPEVGGPIDPDSEAHDLIMSVFGGMSKGERNRIRLRVRAAMAAQAAVEGRAPRRPAALRLQDRRRRAAPQPRQGRRRQTAAQARTRPADRVGGPADLRRVRGRTRPVRHRRGAHPRPRPLPRPSTTRPAARSDRARMQLTQTIRELATAQPPAAAPEPAATSAGTRAIIDDCDARLARYQATLNTGADPQTIAEWTRQVKAERAAALARDASQTRRQASRQLTEDDIRALITGLGDLRDVIRAADPAVKAAIYGQLGLKATYLPGQDKLRADVTISPEKFLEHIDQCGVMGSVRGDLNT